MDEQSGQGHGRRFGMPGEGSGRSGRDRLLVLALKPAHLLTGEPEFLGDRVLRHVLPAGVVDRLAEATACAFDERPRVYLGLFVGATRVDDVSHRVRHPLIVARIGQPP